MRTKLSNLLDSDKDQAFLLVNDNNGSVIGVFSGSLVETDQTPIERIEVMIQEEYSVDEVIFTEVEQPDGITFKVLDEEGDVLAHLGLTQTWIY